MEDQAAPSPIARDLRAILDLTAHALARPFTMEEASKLLESREGLVRKIAAAREAGGAFGPEEATLLRQLVAMDDQAIGVLRAPHADAFAWLAAREKARADAPSETAVDLNKGAA